MATSCTERHTTLLKFYGRNSWSKFDLYSRKERLELIFMISTSEFIPDVIGVIFEHWDILLGEMCEIAEPSYKCLVVCLWFDCKMRTSVGWIDKHSLQSSWLSVRAKVTSIRGAGFKSYCRFLIARPYSWELERWAAELRIIYRPSRGLRLDSVLSPTKIIITSWEFTVQDTYTYDQ